MTDQSPSRLAHSTPNHGLRGRFHPLLDFQLTSRSGGGGRGGGGRMRLCQGSHRPLAYSAGSCSPSCPRPTRCPLATTTPPGQMPLPPSHPFFRFKTRPKRVWVGGGADARLTAFVSVGAGCCWDRPARGAGELEAECEPKQLLLPPPCAIRPPSSFLNPTASSRFSHSSLLTIQKCTGSGGVTISNSGAPALPGAQSLRPRPLSRRWRWFGSTSGR